MKTHLKRLLTAFCILFLTIAATKAQTLEWRLANPTFNATDPDGTGPATGIAAFTLQIHTVTGTISNITGMSAGWSWQSTNAMLPTGPNPAPTCGTSSVAQPSNVTMSPTFLTLGFTYNNVNECSGNVNFTAGDQTFDRRAVGTVDGGAIDLTTDWVDVFTVTLWSVSSNPNAGYVVINSGAGGETAPFSTYSVSDADANEYVVNSLTFGTPLLLNNGILPVLFTKFNAACSETGIVITWSTATETNNSHFVVEKSTDGISWMSVGLVSGSANSHTANSYQLIDKVGGAALYRIKQVDINGATSYTNIVSATCNSSSFFVSLYPNPTKDKLTLFIRSDKALKTTIQVVDSYGRVAMNVPITINKGTNTFTFNVNHLAQGQYHLRGSEEGIEIKQRFTILR